MKNLQQPLKWQVGLVLVVGVIGVSTAAIFIRLALAATHSPSLGFSLFLSASRLTLAALLLLPAWWNQKPLPQGNACGSSGTADKGEAATAPGGDLQTDDKACGSPAGNVLENGGVGATDPNRLDSRAQAQLSLRAWGYAIAAGVCLALHFATWIPSLFFTSIAASTTLVTTNPIWVALLSWLWFKEKPTWLLILGIGIALLGGSLITLGDVGATPIGSHPLLGNTLALVGAWMYSLYLLLGREAQRFGLGIGNYAVIAYTTGAILLLPLPVLCGASYIGYPIEVYVYTFLMAALSQVVGHTTLNWTVRWISPTLVSVAILSEPVSASFLGYLIFKEVPGELVLAGVAVLLVGVAVSLLGMRETID